MVMIFPVVFPVVLYGCESWTIKKVKCWRIDAFELWCWSRLMRVRWTARRSNQSIVKEISPECSFEGLMLNLKLQYFGHVMGRTDSLKKTLMLRKIDGRSDNRGWNDWMTSPTQWTWIWVNSGSWWWTGKPGMPQSMGSQIVGHDWATELNWTEGKCCCPGASSLWMPYEYICPSLGKFKGHVTGKNKDTFWSHHMSPFSSVY